MRCSVVELVCLQVTETLLNMTLLTVTDMNRAIVQLKAENNPVFNEMNSSFNVVLVITCVDVNITMLLRAAPCRGNWASNFRCNTTVLVAFHHF